MLTCDVYLYCLPVLSSCDVYLANVMITWLVSATVDVPYVLQAAHNRPPLVVDVIKRRRL